MHGNIVDGRSAPNLKRRYVNMLLTKENLEKFGFKVLSDAEYAEYSKIDPEFCCTDEDEENEEYLEDNPEDE